MIHASLAPNLEWVFVPVAPPRRLLPLSLAFGNINAGDKLLVLVHVLGVVSAGMFQCVLESMAAIRSNAPRACLL